jgi:hypothetical protein
MKKPPVKQNVGTGIHILLAGGIQTSMPREVVKINDHLREELYSQILSDHVRIYVL